MKFLIATTLFLLSSFGNSLRCAQGSVPSELNVCITPTFIEGCSVYESESSCRICNFNYRLEENGLCSYDSHSTENCCLKHGRNQNCLQCNRGLSLVNGSCKQIKIVGCLEKTEGGKCANCAKGFYLSNGECMKGIKNCQQYQSDTEKLTCKQCEESYSLVSNYCLKNKILGCKTEEFNICKQCYPPFSLTSGHCEIKNCKTYTDFGCATCLCGHFITKNRVCEKIEDGCIRHQKGVCTDCIQPFQLQGATCVLDGCKVMENMRCEKCDSNYELKDGVCRLPNCLEASNGICKVCEKGFNYSSGSCTQQRPKLVFA